MVKGVTKMKLLVLIITIDLTIMAAVMAYEFVASFYEPQEMAFQLQPAPKPTMEMF